MSSEGQWSGGWLFLGGKWRSPEELRMLYRADRAAERGRGAEAAVFWSAAAAMEGAEPPFLDVGAGI